MKIAQLTLICVLLVSFTLAGCGKRGSVSDSDIESEVELYTDAQNHLKSGRFELAIEKFTALKTTYPYGKYTAQSELELCYAYYKSRESERAIPCLDLFLLLHPNHTHIDYAWYLKGLASLPVRAPKPGERFFKSQEQFSDHDVESARDAYAIFTKVVETFPLSEYAESSRQIVIDLINTFARHNLRIARFYLHRDAYVAASKRAKEVLDSYSISPHTEEALAILIYAFENLGLNESAQNSRSVLELNFPNSEFLLDSSAVLDDKLIEQKNKKILLGLFQ